MTLTRSSRRARLVAKTLATTLVNVLLAAVLLSPSTAVAQRATLVVRITEQSNNAPVPQAQVTVVGTSIGGLTNSDGRATLANVPAGSVQLRVLRIGYGESKRTVTVASGTNPVVEMQLVALPVTLVPVVSTATGQTRRVELGNSITSIDAAQVAATSPVSSLSDLLNSRAPGVTITSGTQAGSGSRVRIRGINSVSLSNEPIYVIDGVRMTSNANSSSFGTGGNGASRVGDLNPEEIENIEVVKGPSAATLYGTDAANGVIVITTKKGRSGSARWTVYGEGGLISDRNTYPTNYSIWGKTGTSTTSSPNCVLSQLSSGACVKDSVTTYSPFYDKDATPIGTGNRAQFGVQVAGGSDMLRYFLSAERENETGVLQLPDFERRRLDSTATPIRPWTDRPNLSNRNSVRANLNAAINSKLDVGITSNLIMVNQRYSLESNATAGIGSQAFGGPGYKNNGTVSGVGAALNGYRAWTPGFTWQEKTGQTVTRIIAGANLNYRPFSWNVTRLNIGNDYTSRVDDRLLYKGEGPPVNATYRLGFKSNGRTAIRNFSVDAASSGEWRARPWLLSKTSVGLQYINYNLNQNVATGNDLVPGSQTTGAGATKNATEATTFQKTAGVFVEEALAIRDRLFLTMAARSDQNSAFGTNFQSVIYPKFSASWVISDEGFMPTGSWMDNLRLRMALGSSGVQPGPNDALRYYASSTSSVRNTDTPGAVYSAIGNKGLKPERTTELEAGFDLRMFRGRLNVEATYYNKNTKDALVLAVVPPSAGASTTQASNLGAVNNHGLELLLNTVLVDRRHFATDLTISGSMNSNRVNSLGNTPPQIGEINRVAEGYPINGFWSRPITGWEDKNKDGILRYDANAALNEVFVGDSAIFRGYNQPRYMLTATNGIELFGKKLRLQSLTDYRGGHLYYNNTERIRCVSRRNCNGLVNPAASLEEQAMVIAALDHPSRTLDGFIQTGAFIRLRELSATYQVSPRVASLIKARSGSVTFTARNLGRYTKYRGVDPETDRNASVDSDSPEEFQTFAPPSYFVLRFNIGY